MPLVELEPQECEAYIFLSLGSNSLLSTFGVIRNEGAWVVRLCSVSASLGVTVGKAITRPTEHPRLLLPVFSRTSAGPASGCVALSVSPTSQATLHGRRDPLVIT